MKNGIASPAAIVERMSPPIAPIPPRRAQHCRARRQSSMLTVLRPRLPERLTPTSAAPRKLSTRCSGDRVNGGRFVMAASLMPRTVGAAVRGRTWGRRPFADLWSLPSNPWLVRRQGCSRAHQVRCLPGALPRHGAPSRAGNPAQRMKAPLRGRFFAVLRPETRHSARHAEHSARIALKSAELRGLAATFEAADRPRGQPRST